MADYWRQVFIQECNQVENVDVHPETDSLDIHFREHRDTLQATAQELNESLMKFNGNPRDTVVAFLKKHGKLVLYQDTLVGFFDIHGYSSFIERDKTNIRNAVWKINSLFSEIQSWARTDLGPVKFDSWILSDSIILVINTDRCRLNIGSIRLLFWTCSQIMKAAMVKSFPLRGAIGGGDFFKDGEIMVSSALVNAACYEKAQNWFGAVVTPEAYALVENARKYPATFQGETFEAFTWADFSNWVREGVGVIPWNNKEVCKDLRKHDVRYYIKPVMIGDNWTSCLPDYIEDKKNKKISNSNCLYAQT